MAAHQSGSPREEWAQLGSPWQAPDANAQVDTPSAVPGTQLSLLAGTLPVPPLATRDCAHLRLSTPQNPALTGSAVCTCTDRPRGAYTLKNPTS